jgi:uncharacterized protein involved in propanediol utilization
MQQLLPIEQVHTASVFGHFGEFLQGRLGPDGPIALVTVPCNSFKAHAFLEVDGPFQLHMPGAPLVSAPQVTALYARLSGTPPSGRLTIRATMPPGGGAGSSTAALMAAARVIAAGAGRPLPPPLELSLLCLDLEGATDPIGFPHPERLLWAPRAAVALRCMPRLPAMAIVGGFNGSSRTDPADTDFADIADLVAEWAVSACHGDLGRLASLATESAHRNACHRRLPPLDGWLQIARRNGALGIVAAHTGSALGLIFAPSHEGRMRAAAELRAHGLAQVVNFRISAQ